MLIKKDDDRELKIKHNGIRLGIAGATGLVGKMMLKVLEERKIAIVNLELYASTKSASSIINYFGKEYKVLDIEKTDFQNVDYVLFALDENIAGKYIEKALEANCIVIDNSALYRMKDNVPLIAFGVNDSVLNESDHLIANPNCSTLTTISLLDVINKKYGISSISYATYQSVSGSGIKGIKDLLDTRKNLKSQFYQYPISETCIPLIGRINNTGYSSEEEKMINETRKILENENIKISATCIRVPVLNCHGVLVKAKLKKAFYIEDIKSIFKKTKGIIVLEEPHLPNSVLATGSDFVYVGRMRRDTSDENSILFYAVTDNLRRGAASNAVDILIKLIKQRG